MFLLSKILGLATQPLLWVLALLGFGLLLQRRKGHIAWRLIWAAFIVLLVAGWKPLPELVLRQLEGQYAEVHPQADVSAFVGVVVLGGATESGRVQQAHSQPLLGGGAERLTAPIALLRHNPKLQLIYTGGEGALLGSGPSEADRARLFFDAMGAPQQQIQYESQSRNTYENAVLSARLPHVDTTQRWLLVTSAFHMPRSMATFTKAGWNVTAYPVDFQTGGETVWLDYGLGGSIYQWELALHECLGLLAYRLTGRM
jgi:uncharacterized SAM-binding protein YcdF (DUF218 family)